MATLIRAGEAAALLDVSKATLYAYVSRGRLSRTTAVDGRTSLFARDEVEQLAARSRRASSGPRPTIDVHIASRVTAMSEGQLMYRGRDAVELAATSTFEAVAELLWAEESSEAPAATTWPSITREDDRALSVVIGIGASPIGRMAIAAHVLAGLHPHDDATAAARRLLVCTPMVFGSSRRTGPYARRLASSWRRRPDPEFAEAIDTTLALLADHELSTSTIAVRIAASVRASPYVAFAAGLATIDAPLHGAASADAHRFLDECAASEPSIVVEARRTERQRIPGFGHKVYRGVDPRFGPLMTHVRRLDPDDAIVDAVVAEVGRTLPVQPNVDLALGALTRAAGLPPDTPLFAIARLAGWAAHYGEELRERPVRFRGIARPT